MRDKLYYTAGVITLVSAIAVTFWINMPARPPAPHVRVPENTNTALIGEIYNISFTAPKNNPDNMTSYILKFAGSDIDKPFYAALLGAPDLVSENEDYYFFSGEAAEVTFDKFLHHIAFISKKSFDSGDKPVSPLDAINISKNFFKDKQMDLKFAEALVTKTPPDNDGYNILFINKRNGILDYSFPTEVRMDIYGNILGFDYFNLAYERIAVCAVMPARYAVYGLPVDFEPGTRIDLKSAELVYYYKHSIIQPAYLFTGEFVNENKEFRHFVNAAVYG